MNKQSYATVSDKENYFDSKNALSEEEALAMIKRFPKHKNRITGKKHIRNSWAVFDHKDLKNAVHDDHVVEIKFFLAALINEDN